MRRGILTFCFSSLLLAGSARAQSVRGTIRDVVSGVPIGGASIQILPSEQTVNSDRNGAFALDAPLTWPATLVVGHTGYRVARLVLATPPSSPLDVALEPVISIADRIEVTATRAREGADPISFTNVPAERVAESYWGQDPAILLSSLGPGFVAYNDSGNGIGYSYFTVRGFGQSRTRVTLNGAPLNDAESGELFFIDLADFLATAGDVQLRRGVFGLSGIGGAVDITTAAAEVEPAFTLHTGLGSYGTQRLSARFDSGLINGTWALGARYSKVQTDGYRDQSWVDMWNYYISLTRYGQRSRLRLVFFGGPEQTHLAYNGVSKAVLEGGLSGNEDRDRRYNPITYPGEIDNFTQPHYQLIHELSISANTQLTQTLYAFRGDGYYDQLRLNRSLKEYDLPNVVLADGTVIKKSDMVRRRTVGEWDAGWTPTLTHEVGSWTLSAAGELRFHEAHHVGEVTWAQYYPVNVPPDHRYYDYRVAKRSAALSLGATWRATDAVTLTGGVQLTRHQYELSRDRIKGVAFDESFEFFLPRLGAVVRLSDSVDAYINVARGMREPNLRDIYDPQDYYGARASLDPEDVIDYEAGVSARSANWRVRANLFWMEFDNAIVYAGALDDNGVPVYGNGAQAEHRGIELEGSWAPSRRLGLDATFTMSRNTFTRYRVFDWEGRSTSFDGNRIAGYPDRIAALTARTEVGPLKLALAGRHVGRFYLDNSEDNRKTPAARKEPGYVALVNPSYTVLDASMRLPLPAQLTRPLGLDALDLELRVNNLLDRTYTAFGYVDGEPLFIPAATRNYYFGFNLGL
jgi:iron complex outermembrane receptor protein